MWKHFLQLAPQTHVNAIAISRELGLALRSLAFTMTADCTPLSDFQQTTHTFPRYSRRVHCESVRSVRILWRGGIKCEVKV